MEPMENWQARFDLRGINFDTEMLGQDIRSLQRELERDKRRLDAQHDRDVSAQERAQLAQEIADLQRQLRIDEARFARERAEHDARFPQLPELEVEENEAWNLLPWGVITVALARYFIIESATD